MRLNRVIIMLLIFGVGLFVCPRAVFAGDVALSVTTVSTDDRVSLSVLNTGKDPAQSLSVVLELGGKSYRRPLARELAPGQRRSVSFKVTLPRKHGTYPLYSTVFYRNDGYRLSLINVGYFNYRREVALQVPCLLPVVRLSDRSEISLKLPKGYRFRLFLPREIEIEKQVATIGGRRYTLRNSRPELSSNYGIFGILESPKEWPVQSTRICESRLYTSKVYSRKSLFPDWLILSFAAAGLLLCWALFRKGLGVDLSRIEKTVLRSCFSVFLISVLYYGFRNAYHVAEAVLPLLYSWAPENRFLVYLWSSCDTLLRWLYFTGIEYDYFFRWIADPLYFYMLLLNPFVLFYLVRPEAGTDKYWSLMSACFSLPVVRTTLGKSRPKKFEWTSQARLAVLTIMVKVFYVPLISSWTINQGMHLGHLFRGAGWDFYAVNAFLVNSLIMLDLAIFAVGYLTELPQLKNKIRSVEPTVLGWVVCLACYPPFNRFSFQLVDEPLNEYWTPSFGITAKLVVAVITVLWAIYVWASIALGTKASNLTNRGIVERGPYRYVRHPAYASKVGLWILSSFFMGEKNFYLVLALVLVYVLRAWTEERHLSRDPDYLVYKKKVPWKIIPRIF